jgi:anti-sigma B factor antagonist
LPGTDPIKTTVTRHDGAAVLAVHGEVDVATVGAMESAITEALSGGPAALVIDLTDVGFLASAGLQVLVATRERLGDGAQFAVVAEGPATSRPIQLTGLDQILSLHSTLAEALAALKKA